MKKLLFYFLLISISVYGFGQNAKFAPVSNTGVSELGDNYSNQNAVSRSEINHSNKSMSLWALPTDNSTSGNTRIPGNAHKYQRTQYLITANEMSNSGFPSGNTIDAIGWLIATAGGTTQTGNLKIWLRNTTDVTYQLGSSWTTAGFTLVSDIAAWTVPITVGSYVVNFAGGTPFTYTGGGVYVAFEFSNPGTAGTTALVANCNTSLANSLYGQRSATVLPTALVVSSFRPATMFVNNSMNDVANITNIYSLERIPIPFATPNPINVRVANVSNSAATFDIILTVKDITNTIVKYTETQTVSSMAANTASIFTFTGWMPTTTEDVNINVTTSAISGETWLSNNSLSKVVSVNDNLFSYNYNLTGGGGYGYTWSSTYTGGLFASKFTMNGIGAVPGANLFISNTASNTGNTIYAVVLNSSGAIVAQSANYIIQASDLGTNKNFTFPIPPVFTNEIFYVALAQTPGAAQYYPLGTFPESPGRTSTFYTSAITGGTLVQLATTSNLKYGIEAQVVAFSGPNNPANFTATTISPNQINLGYLLNSNGNNVLIAYNTSNIFGAPVNGTIYNPGDAIVGGGTVLQYNNSTLFNHTALIPNTTYYYKIWSYDGSFYSGGVVANTTTYCSSTSIPFVENFDNPAVCGTVIDANTDNVRWSLSTSNAYSGTKKLSIGYSAVGVTMNDWFFTQGLELNAGQSYDVKFYYRSVSATFVERLEVKWGTSATSAGMNSTAIFNQIDFNNTAYTLGSGSFTPSLNGTYYVGWHCYSQPDQDGIYIDSVTITETPACPLPSALTVSEIKSTNAKISWTGLAPSWEVEYGTTGFIQGTGNMISVATNPDTLTGLIPSTSYSYYVRSNCGGGSYSTWVGPYTFSTLCSSSVTPLIETFESSTFPPACWSNLAVNGSFTWSRSTSASANGEGTASIIADFFNQSAGSYDLKTIPFDISTLTNPTLTFNFAYATYATEVDQLNIYYSSDYGSSWSLLLNMPGGVSGILNTGGVKTSAFIPTSSQWGKQFIALPPSANMIKFTAVSAYGNNLYLDNIRVFSPYDHDISATSIDLNQVTALGNPIPKATVSNIGINTETFNVSLTIGSYTSTKTIAALAPNASTQVSFDAWPNEIGDFNANLEITLATDMDLTNNLITKIIKVMNLNKTVYAYQNSAVSGTVKFNMSDPSIITLLDNQTTQPSINAGTWANGIWYATATNTLAPYNFMSIDTATGARLIIGDMGLSINGLAYNSVNSTMYGVAYNSVTTQSSLYSINMTNGTVTLIGNTLPGILLINLAINNNGECYSVDINSDQLGIVNLTTGLFSPIGSVGFNAGYAQDMEFDRESNELYMAAYGSTGELRWVNKSTGNTLLIGSFQNGMEITGFAIPYSKTLKGKVFLAGLYSSNGIMNQAQNENASQYGNNIADKILVELNNSATASIVEASFSNVDLQTDGTFTIKLPSNLSDSYYIVIKHRNSISVWSSLALAFNSAMVNYDFTNSASQAFGNNLIQLEPGIYGVYTGDVNQDGLVDGSDMSDTETDNNSFTIGYVVTDVNGDGLVDGSDMSLVETSNNNFVSEIMP